MIEFTWRTWPNVHTVTRIIPRDLVLAHIASRIALGWDFVSATEVLDIETKGRLWNAYLVALDAGLNPVRPF